MSIRSALKQLFLTGKKPSQSDFADLIDSFVHTTEDKASITLINAGIDNGTFVTPSGVKAGVLKFAPVKSINGSTGTDGDVTIIEGQSKIFAIPDAPNSLGNVNTSQNVFPSNMSVFTLDGNRLYAFKGKYLIGAGTTSHSVKIGFTLSSSFISDISYVSQGIKSGGAALVSASIKFAFHNAVSLVQITNDTTDSHSIITFEGHIRTQASGTVTPKFQFSVAPGGSPSLLKGSFIEFTDIGRADVVKSAGVN